MPDACVKYRHECMVPRIASSLSGCLCTLYIVSDNWFSTTDCTDNNNLYYTTFTEEEEKRRCCWTKRKKNACCFVCVFFTHFYATNHIRRSHRSHSTSKQFFNCDIIFISEQLNNEFIGVGWLWIQQWFKRCWKYNWYDQFTR